MCYPYWFCHHAALGRCLFHRHWICFSRASPASSAASHCTEYHSAYSSAQLQHLFLQSWNTSKWFFFFFVLLVPSISFSLTALWKCRETYKHISVNTSDVVPEFKSFTHNTGRHDLGLFVWRKKAELAKNLTALYVCVCVCEQKQLCVFTRCFWQVIHLCFLFFPPDLCVELMSTFRDAQSVHFWVFSPEAALVKSPRINVYTLFIQIQGEWKQV